MEEKQFDEWNAEHRANELADRTFAGVVRREKAWKRAIGIAVVVFAIIAAVWFFQSPYSQYQNLRTPSARNTFIIIGVIFIIFIFLLINAHRLEKRDKKCEDLDYSESQKEKPVSSAEIESQEEAKA